jgi:type II secretory pathway pseudopilin PulG
MMKKGFTLIELLVIFIILAIVVTFAIPVYLNAVEAAKSRACELNLEAILGAVEGLAEEEHALPGSFSQLRKEHIRKSWAKLIEKRGAWYVKGIYLIVDMNNHGLAYASDAWAQRYSDYFDVFICPADPTPPPDGYSYGLNSEYANMSLDDYKDLPASAVIVADSDDPVFGSMAERHKKVRLSGSQYYAIAITKGREFIYPGLPPGPGDDDDAGPPGDDDDAGPPGDDDDAGPPGDDDDSD